MVSRRNAWTPPSQATLTKPTRRSPSVAQTHPRLRWRIGSQSWSPTWSQAAVRRALSSWFDTGLLPLKMTANDAPFFPRASDGDRLRPSSPRPNDNPFPCLIPAASQEERLKTGRESLWGRLSTSAIAGQGRSVGRRQQLCASRGWYREDAESLWEAEEFPDNPLHGHLLVRDPADGDPADLHPPLARGDARDRDGGCLRRPGGWRSHRGVAFTPPAEGRLAERRSPAGTGGTQPGQVSLRRGGAPPHCVAARSRPARPPGAIGP